MIIKIEAVLSTYRLLYFHAGCWMPLMLLILMSFKSEEIKTKTIAQDLIRGRKRRVGFSVKIFEAKNYFLSKTIR